MENEETNQNLTMTQNVQAPTFADKLKQTNKPKQTLTFPSKKQAIIISGKHEMIPLITYIKKISEIVKPENIIFASPLANNRICIYLSDEKLVDQIIETKNNIKINNEQLEIRRLVMPTKRIMISNVSPSIPHNILEDELHKLGLKTVSGIHFLRAGLPEPEFSHIMSFRRQVYVADDGKTIIPETTTIYYDETEYRIYLKEDTCQKCKKTGHRTNQCPINITQSENLMQKIQTKLNIQQETNIDNTQLIRPSTSQVYEIPLIQKNQPRKRPKNSESQESLSSEENTGPGPTQDENTAEKMDTTNDKELINNNTKRRQKKQRSTSPTHQLTTEELIKHAQIEIKKHPTKYVLKFDEFRDFIENACGDSDPLAIATEYTVEPKKLLKMIQDVHQLLQHKSAKARLKRLENKLKFQLEEEEEEIHEAAEEYLNTQNSPIPTSKIQPHHVYNTME